MSAKLNERNETTAKVRVLDEADPTVDGQYDRHDVATICRNFTGSR